jgi:hypothetical protein
LDPKYNTGYDDIVSYEIFARNNNSHEALYLVKNETNVGNSSTFNYYSFTMTVPDYSCYYFAYKARNSFGASRLSKEFLFVAAYPPKAIDQVVVSYVGQNVSFSWSNSFEKNGYEFIWFDISLGY